MGLGHGHNHENVSIGTILYNTYYGFLKNFQFKVGLILLLLHADWDSIKWDELTPEEKWNYEHLR
jgi:hypothetical protein